MIVACESCIAIVFFWRRLPLAICQGLSGAAGTCCESLYRTGVLESRAKVFNLHKNGVIFPAGEEKEAPAAPQRVPPDRGSSAD